MISSSTAGVGPQVAPSIFQDKKNKMSIDGKLKQVLSQEEILQKELPLYIDLKTENQEPIECAILSLMQSTKEAKRSFGPSDEVKVLLISGEKGSGKTFFCLKYALDQLNLFDSENSDRPLVIYVPLDKLEDPFNNALEEGLKRYHINRQSDIDDLRSSKVLWILDGYDDIKFGLDFAGAPNLKNLYATNSFRDWPNSKFIFTCRESTPVEKFKPTDGVLSHVKIAPLKPQEIVKYGETCAKLYNFPLNACEMLLKMFETYSCFELLSNPLMLKSISKAALLLIQNLDRSLPVKSNNKDFSNQKAIVEAIQTGSLKKLEVLFQNRGNLSGYYVQGGFSFSMPLYAIARGELKCFKFLKSNTRFSWNDTVKGIGNLLHVAVHFNQLSVFKEILTKYEEELLPLRDEKDHLGRTPFLLAAHLGNQEAIDILSGMGSFHEERDEKGRSALHLAAMQGYLETVQHLIWFNIDSTACDHDNKSVLDLYKGSVEGLKKLKLMISKPYIANEFTFKDHVTKNLIFSGDSYSLFNYGGVTAALESKNDHLKDLQRVVGSSIAGSLAAAFTALNLDPEKIDLLFSMIERDKEALMQEKLDLYLTLESQKFIENLNASLDTSSHPEWFFTKLCQFIGYSDGEDFRKLVEEMIFEKTKIPFCTLGNLFNMAREGSCKHLHLFGTRLGEENEVVHFSSEDPKWQSLIISDLLRLALPSGLYKPHRLHTRPVNSMERGPLISEGLFTSATLSNVALTDIFDKKEYLTSAEVKDKDQLIFNRSILHVTCTSDQFSIDNEDALKKLNSFFKIPEVKINNVKYNHSRTIEIDALASITAAVKKDKEYDPFKNIPPETCDDHFDIGWEAAVNSNYFNPKVSKK